MVAVVGTVGVQVVPVATDFARKLRESLVPEADRIGAEVGRVLSERIQAAMGDVRVRVDTAGATADIDLIREDLRRLNSDSARIDVRVDTERARLELDELRARLDRLGATSTTHTVRINQQGDSTNGGDSGGGLTGGVGLLGVGLSLLPAAIPMLASIAPIIEGIGLAGVGAAAGVGVLGLAFHGIGAAVSALGTQQAQTGQQVAAQAAAQLAAANAVINAQDAVKAAVVAAADARRSAAMSVTNAENSVVSAEQSLTSAQYTETQAQTALTLARRQAAQTLQDLSNQVKDGALTQRQATIDLQNAQQNLTVVDFNPHSTPQQRAEAQLAVDQAKQRLSEIELANSRLAQTKAAADKAGVANAPAVRAAEHSLADATIARRNAQQALARAQAAVVEAQRAGTEQILKADLAVVASQRALAQAYASAGAQGNSAANAVATAMAGLSPAGQAFAHFIVDVIKPAFRTLTDAAQTGFLPLFQQAIETLLPYLPQLAKFVGTIAKVLGDMALAAAQAFTQPFWKQFFSFLASIAGPSLQTLGSMIGNLATGLAGLFEALAPAGVSAGAGLVNITKAFADWATHLGTNKGFQAFLQYVKDNGPLVGRFFGDLLQLVGKLIVGFAPLGAVMLRLLDLVAGFLAKMSPNQLMELAGSLGAVALAVMAFTGGPVGLAIAAIVGIAGALASLYTHNKPFHDFVDGMVAKLREFVGWVKDHWPEMSAVIKKEWDTVLYPVFEKFGRIVKDLWDSYLSPVFSFIKDHWAGIAFAIGIGATLINRYITTVGTAISFLYWDVFKPMVGFLILAWKNLSDGISSIYTSGLKPIWSSLTTAFTTVGKAFGTFRDGLSAVWKDIRTIFTDGYNFVTQKVLNKFIGAINDVTSVLGVPKIPAIAAITAAASGGGGGGGGGANGGGGNKKSYAFAHGGIVPGGYMPGQDIVHAMVSPGEGILVPEAVRGLGGEDVIHALNKQFSNRTSSLGHFAGGGIVGSIINAGADAVLTGAEAPVKEMIKHLSPQIVKRLAEGGFGRIDGGIRSWIGHNVGGSSGMAASIANLSHQTLIKAALKLAGVADTASNEGDVDMIIKFESGWNPNAINLTDSNALAGHPSQGLMQTIASTFEAWRLPTLPDSITDPLANMVAGIRYAVGRYGSLDQVPGVASVHGGGGYVGYDNGGYLKPGVTQVYNGTGKPEPVFTPEQWATLSSQRGSGGKIAENLHIYGDNPEAIIHEVARRQSMAGQI